MKGKKESSVSKLVFFFICGVIGGLLGVSIIEAFGDSITWWQLLIRLFEGLFLLFIAFLVQVIMHEAGHMFAGLLRGWGFISFTVLGFVFSRREGKFHISRFAIPGVGGQCLMMPPKEGDSDFGIALYNAGGVLMNLVIMMASFWLLVTNFSQMPWEISVLLGSLFLTGLLFAVTNGIPSCHGGIPNDGMNIRELRKDSFSTHVFLDVMRMLGSLQQGQWLDKIGVNYLSDGVELDYANPIHVMAVNFDVSLAIARLDFDKAHALFMRMQPEVHKIIPIYRKELLYEKVFLFLVSPRDGVDVGNLIDSETLKYFEMQTVFRPTSLRVKYAFARLYEGNEAKAAVIYRQFQQVCETYHVPGEVQSEKRLVEYVRTLVPTEV